MASAKRKPGVIFRDITPLLADGAAFSRCIDALVEPWQGSQVQAVCGVESRGFIFAAAMAQKLGAGFIPLRKPGKLPPPVMHADYQLEYNKTYTTQPFGVDKVPEFTVRPYDFFQHFVIPLSAQFTEYTTGIIGATDVEVLTGLSEGDQIITGTYKVIKTLRNSAKVKVDNKAPVAKSES